MIDSPKPSAPLVVHVLPSDVTSGVQMFAKLLRDRLDGPEVRHRTLTLFDWQRSMLRADHELGYPSGFLRRAGFDPRVIPQLRRKLRTLAPDVVVAHGGEPLKYCGAARPKSSRLVYLKVGSSETEVRRRLHAAWHQRLMRSADRVVVISDDLAAEALTLFGVDAERIVVIPSGRDPDLFHQTNHDSKPVRLLYLSHLTQPKRPLQFVALVRRLVAAHQPVTATMVGDGPLLDEVRDAAANLPIDVLERCDNVPGLLSFSHLLVFPGEAAEEGLPGTYLEAGFSGVPVVTTAVTGASTVIDSGVTGYIVPTDDLDQLVQRTGELVADADRRRAMGDAARSRCLNQFTLDSVADSWSRLLTPTATGHQAR